MRPPGIAAALVAGAIGTLLLLVRSLVVAGIGACVVGVAAGLPFAAAFATAQRLRPENPATAVALVNALANGVILLVTPIVGIAIAAGGAVPAFAAVAALWLLPLVALPRFEN